MPDRASCLSEAGSGRAAGAQCDADNQQHGDRKQLNEYAQGKQHLQSIVPAKISSFQSRTEKQTFVGWLL
jgi:hypothetical protein